MLIIIIVLSILFVYYFISLFLLKREMKSIKNQLHKYSKGVEKPIDIVFINKYLTELAAEINKNQSLQKENKLSCLKRERHLKESILNISHDLRTPLTSIIGYLQLLQKTCLTDEQREYLDISLSRGRYLQSLISDFYDISILESRDIATLKINLDNIIIDMVLSFTEQLEEKNIKPIIKLLDTPTYVMADETMLKRVIINLISNTIKYGTKELKIELLEKGFIEVTFQNEVENNKSIDISRLFEKLYTTDSSRNQTGSGLGLYIVKILVQKMGGNVSANFKDNKLIISLFLVKI